MLRTDIQTAITTSLKEKKLTELKVLRFVLSQIKYQEIDKHAELTDGEIVTLIQKEIKKRKEAIELFKKGNRQDLVTDEEAQIAILEKYVPQQLGEEELKKIVDEVVAQVGTTANMGQMIGQVMARVKGQADGSFVSRLVREKLKPS